MTAVEECRCHLKRNVYGLKQVPRCWKKPDFRSVLLIACLFYQRGHRNQLYAVSYLAEEDQLLTITKTKLRSCNRIATGYLGDFLDMKIQYRKDRTIIVSQEHCPKRVLKRFGIVFGLNQIKIDESDHLADLLAKPVDRLRFGKLLKKFGVYKISSLLKPYFRRKCQRECIDFDWYDHLLVDHENPTKKIQKGRK